MKGKNGFFVNINTCMDEVKKVCQKYMKILRSHLTHTDFLELLPKIYSIYVCFRFDKTRNPNNMSTHSIPQYLFYCHINPFIPVTAKTATSQVDLQV